MPACRFVANVLRMRSEIGDCVTCTGSGHGHRFSRTIIRKLWLHSPFPVGHTNASAKQKTIDLLTRYIKFMMSNIQEGGMDTLHYTTNYRDPCHSDPAQTLPRSPRSHHRRDGRLLRRVCVCLTVALWIRLRRSRLLRALLLVEHRDGSWEINGKDVCEAVTGDMAVFEARCCTLVYASCPLP